MLESGHEEGSATPKKEALMQGKKKKADWGWDREDEIR